MPFCFECGGQVAPDDPFCGNCGIAQKPTFAPTTNPGNIEKVNPSLAVTAAPTETETETQASQVPQIIDVSEETFQSVNAHAAPAQDPENEASPPRGNTAPELRDTLVGAVDALIPHEAESDATGADIDEVETIISKLPITDGLAQPEASEASEEVVSGSAFAETNPDFAATGSDFADIDSDFEETIPAFSEASDAPEPIEAARQEPVEAAPPAESVNEPVESANEPAEEIAPASRTPEPAATPRPDDATVKPEPASAPETLPSALNAEASSDTEASPDTERSDAASSGEERNDAASSDTERDVAALHDTLPPEAVSRSTGELSSGARSMDATVPSGTTAGNRRQVSKQLEAGTLLNVRYEIVRRIGGGGMGAVYLAKDRHLGDAPRAVKEMIETHLDESQHEKAIGDFKRESLLLTSLEHPSIPTIYDYFYDDQAGRFYLVMKYISGGDFASRLRNAPGGRIDEKTGTIWAMEVADVLDYLHNRRPRPIIYRDLKPANLMIDGNSGRVMLIDFGIARWVNKTEEKGVTAVGTMGYAPPELFSGKVEPRSDVYSLGATLFHLLTGSDPQDNPLLIFDFTKNPRPRQINPAISVEMERILMRAVEYKPEGRFRSAGEMREALAAHLERLRVGDVSYGMVTAAQGAGETLQVEMVFCGFCGGRIAADDLFCAHCGAKQPLAGITPSAALQAARSTAKLVVAGTTELDASFLLQKDSNLVGRSDPHSNIFPEVDLSRFDPETKVSRRHARIWRKGETFLVEDLGSINGTVLLGRDNDTVRLAPHQPRVLENGDKLRLGETMLHFLVG